MHRHTEWSEAVSPCMCICPGEQYWAQAYETYGSKQRMPDEPGAMPCRPRQAQMCSSSCRTRIAPCPWRLYTMQAKAGTDELQLMPSFELMCCAACFELCCFILYRPRQVQTSSSSSLSPTAFWRRSAQPPLPARQCAQAVQAQDPGTLTLAAPWRLESCPMLRPA